MHQPKELICGLDIGSDSIRAVLARTPAEAPADAPPGLDAIEILAIGQAPVRNSVQHGEVVNPEGATAAVRAAVEEMEQAAGVEVGEAVVSVGCRSRRTINSSGSISVLDQGRPITRRDVSRAVESAIPRNGGGAWLRPPFTLLHAIPQEFWVDDLDSTTDPTGWTGRNIQSFVHLVSCRQHSLDRLEQAVNRAGITVESLVLAPLAAGEAVLHPEERDRGVVLLDLGSMTTDIAVFRHKALWHSDVMPSGGRAYTRDAELGIPAPHAAAEDAKRRFGSALVDGVPEDEHFPLRTHRGAEQQLYSRRLLANILQLRAESDLTRIREEVHRVLRERTPAQVVLTGGGADLSGIAEVARLVFGGEAEARGPLGISGLRDLASHARFSASVGLCRYGLKQRRRAAERTPAAPFRQAFTSASNRLRRVMGR